MTNKTYVSLWDSERISSSGNHGVGFLENYEDMKLARFKDVMLVDPNFIAFGKEGDIYVFEDMEIEIKANPKAKMNDEEIEELGY